MRWLVGRFIFRNHSGVRREEGEQGGGLAEERGGDALRRVE